VHMEATISKVRHVALGLYHEKGGRPNVEEIAAAAEMSVEEVRRVLDSQPQLFSIDSPVSQSDDTYFSDWLSAGNEGPDGAEADLDSLRKRIDDALSQLSYREREIIKLRFGLGDGYSYSLEEIGYVFNVTRERIRQIESRAFRRLEQFGGLHKFADLVQ